MTIPVEQILAGISEERRAAIEARTAELFAEHQTLAALRKARGYTQSQIAEMMETSQANVAQIERKSDVLVSTVAKVVRAMGGRLSLIAEFDDGRHVPLAIGHDGEVSVREAPQVSALARRAVHHQVRTEAPTPDARQPKRSLLLERLQGIASEHREIRPSLGHVIETGRVSNDGITVVQRFMRPAAFVDGIQFQRQVTEIAHRVVRDEAQAVA